MKEQERIYVAKTIYLLSKMFHDRVSSLFSNFVTTTCHWMQINYYSLKCQPFEMVEEQHIENCRWKKIKLKKKHNFTEQHIKLKKRANNADKQSKLKNCVTTDWAFRGTLAEFRWVNQRFFSIFCYMKYKNHVPFPTCYILSHKIDSVHLCSSL